ncbi:hypothetical protein EIP91_010395 [Steccherinum ochraceum]|uniref:NAD(P)-binding protein n=1 Tax=Steccherinum ochraceum TaxID=92696 RepID=A0A4R0RZD6_9APHY|nr:hypothetical protein EIP91_010395 [Steccherinum ochraceum]
MGNILNVLTAVKWHLFPHATTFTADAIPDLEGRVVIVTGGNVGLGKETIRALLRRNAKVYMASRNKHKADATIRELREDTGKEAIFLELDLACLSSVRRAADEFLRNEPELHILFNNAGIMWPPLALVTQDGYDLQFGTNVLGHFLFTELLIPALAAGAKSSPDHHSRVITTSSAGALLDTVDFQTLKDGPARRRRYTEQLYNQSKFLNVVVARETAKRYAEKNILSISVNPGNINTELMRYKPNWLRYLAALFVLQPPAQGALTQLWAGTSPEAIQYNGEESVEKKRTTLCLENAYGGIWKNRWRFELGDVSSDDCTAVAVFIPLPFSVRLSDRTTAQRQAASLS